MRPLHYRHKNKNFKAKVQTNSILLEVGILRILESLKELEHQSRSVLLERMLLFYLDSFKGVENEKAWRKSTRVFKRANQRKKQKNQRQRAYPKKTFKAQKKAKNHYFQCSSFSFFEKY
ncbi:hypothetical protein [Helicobacter cetorum]|uniref:hypothetical protein n=1 Tax=Helicobacter cetorum TaxID=138563 RepID=UPI000CF1C5FB|nr:hypothetical protein [Helicobacter cetorum]